MILQLSGWRAQLALAGMTDDLMDAVVRKAIVFDNHWNWFNQLELFSVAPYDASS